MRYSQMLLPTTKETPSEAEVVSHQLLLRGGFIRKLTAGIYTYLPLGLAAVQKVAQIVREEMNKSGAQELLMPMVQPADLWRESGRWKKYGAELLRFTDRHERESCLGPTHEEVITDIARKELQSYRQLPMNLYQIQTKFRDEIRPRFGLMRGREFVMKDAYSFDVSDEAAGQSYQKCMMPTTGFSVVAVLISVQLRRIPEPSAARSPMNLWCLAETGEDTLVICEKCSYAANVEKAKVILPEGEGSSDSETLQEMKKVETPGMKKVDRVAEFLNAQASEVIKTMIYLADGEPVAALVRGDREVQPVKLKNLLGADEVEPVDDKTVYDMTKLPVGYLGPVNLPLKVVADQEVMQMTNSICGANEKQYHLTGVQPGRDFEPTISGDLRQITSDDSCPSCQGPLKLTEGIEVGHIFKLGTAYSEAMNATFQDSEGQEKPFVMGCYGIGVSRVVAAAIEQNHDQNGIIFPLPLSPFQVIILNLGLKSEEVTDAAEKLYRDLLQKGIEVLYDDRDERPGSKFKDADLIGIPYRVTVGKTFEKEGSIEIRSRRDGKTDAVPFDQAASLIESMITGDLSSFTGN